MRLICLTGIDGSGKTTLAQNVVAALQAHNCLVIYRYGKVSPFFARILMRLGQATLLRKQDFWGDYRNYSASKKQVMHKPFLIWIYTAAVVVDYVFQMGFKLLPVLFRSGFIILDRYVYDTVINELAVHLNYTPVQAKRAVDLAFKFLPIPLATFLIDLPETVAFNRKTDIPHLDYLTERRQFYCHLKTRTEVECLDGAMPPDMLLDKVVNKLLDLRGTYQ